MARFCRRGVRGSRHRWRSAAEFDLFIRCLGDERVSETRWGIGNSPGWNVRPSDGNMPGGLWHARVDAIKVETPPAPDPLLMYKAKR